MFGLDVPSHWIVLAVLALVFFGHQKLPDVTRSFGRSIRIFKAEMTEMTDETRHAAPSTPPHSAPQPVAATGAPTTEHSAVH
jgi:sec-independent protein translocase protein TatA